MKRPMDRLDVGIILIGLAVGWLLAKLFPLVPR